MIIRNNNDLTIKEVQVVVNHTLEDYPSDQPAVLKDGRLVDPDDEEILYLTEVERMALAPWWWDALKSSSKVILGVSSPWKETKKQHSEEVRPVPHKLLRKAYYRGAKRAFQLALWVFSTESSPEMSQYLEELRGWVEDPNCAVTHVPVSDDEYDFLEPPHKIPF